jgi:hypothetical protein
MASFACTKVVAVARASCVAHPKSALLWEHTQRYATNKAKLEYRARTRFLQGVQPCDVIIIKVKHPRQSDE